MFTLLRRCSEVAEDEVTNIFVLQ